MAGEIDTLKKGPSGEAADAECSDTNGKILMDETKVYA
jgi:hypothetical protein